MYIYTGIYHRDPNSGEAIRNSTHQKGFYFIGKYNVPKTPIVEASVVFELHFGHLSS